MQKRWICIDVCDYTNNSLCNLYDSARDVDGQAFDVYLHTQRSGFKELQFQLPSMCIGENGMERNYRLDYLISDYRIKVQKKKTGSNDIEIDWFLISESKVTHQAFSKNYEIRAGHISNLLNTKRLDLEFSDSEGNNVGTIEEIAGTILEGTGWHLGYVAKFYEEKKYNQSEDIEKVRSFNSEVKTGAFRMISNLCELFDAKPIYHGEGTYAGYKVEGLHNGQLETYKDNCDAYEAQKALEMAINDGWETAEIISIGNLTGRTVDILPMNPFSEDVEEGVVPADVVENKILELYYDKNVKTISRTLNTENIVTKLSSYGSYGDRNGLCSLQKATHEVLCFHGVTANTEYKFTYNGVDYYFTTGAEIYGKIYWSALDFFSRSYVYYHGGSSMYVMYPAQSYPPKIIKTEPTPVSFGTVATQGEKQIRSFRVSCNSNEIEISNGLQFNTTYDNPALINYKEGEPIIINLNAINGPVSIPSISLWVTVENKDADILEVYKEPNTNNPTVLTPTVTEEVNDLPFVMDFSYYRKIGLFNDEMLNATAGYQIKMPSLYQDAEQASLDMSNAKSDLFRTAASGGYIKLHVVDADVPSDPTDINYGQLTLTIDDIIYRTDYDESVRNRFAWNCAEGIKDSGLSIGGTGSVVYIVRQSQNYPTKWTKSYVKMLGNGTANYFYDESGTYYELSSRAEYATLESFPTTGVSGVMYVALDSGKMYAWNNAYNEVKPSNYIYGLNRFQEPTTITLWCAEEAFQSGDIVYLFSADSIAGLFGPREDAIYANRESIEKTTETVTARHPLIFIDESTQVIPQPNQDVLNTYGWCYKSFMDEQSPYYQFGYLYFCYGQIGETGWSQVYISKGGEDPKTNPVVLPTSGYGYYYHVRKGMLYRSVQIDVSTTIWQPLDDSSVDDKRVMAAFQAVIPGCIKQEILTKGVHETYTYTLDDSLPVGNYAFENEFGTYWLFTTDRAHVAGDTLTYDYATKRLWQDTDEHNILSVKEYYFDTLVPFPVYNEMADTLFVQGGFDTTIHQPTPEGNSWISDNLYIHDRIYYEFNLPANAIVYFYDANNQYVTETNASEFLIPAYVTHLRVVSPTQMTSSNYVHVKGYDSCFFVENEKYNILHPVAGGKTTGIYDLMDEFIRLSDEAYLVQLPILQSAQNKINQANIDLMNMLGDMYREGYWQKNDYVEGDENKLYSDSLDNLKEISHPEATYEVDYIELYASDKNVGLSVDESTEDILYPDVDITWAAHLVDPEIDTNRWAYIDDINTCYDQPWNSTLEINTQLSTIGQQSFTDVLAKIAEVSNQTKAKQTIYQRAEVVSTAGKITTETLEGPIQTNNVVTLSGGTANWHTDTKGNMIFEAPDGESALMVTGRGLMIGQDKDAYGDWAWMPAVTGKGVLANAIKAGYISADRIEAGSISTNKLSSMVGKELDISTNQALNLFATTDGTKPAGSLITSHPEGTDSWIAISAKQGNTPASIAIKSGGKIDVEAGGSVNILSNSSLNVTGSSVNITSGGDLKIIAGGTFEVDSSNFKVSSENKYVKTGDFTLNDNGFFVDFHSSYTNDYNFMLTSFDNYLNERNPNKYYNGLLYDPNPNIGEFTATLYYTLRKYNETEGNDDTYAQVSCQMTQNMTGGKNTIYLNYYADEMNVCNPIRPITKLYADNIYYTYMQQRSSRDFKHDIQSLPSVGDTLDRLEPVSFVYDDDEDEKIRYGLIYEDTVEVLPEICTSDESEKAISYIELIPMLLKEIQDLRARIKALEEEREEN